MNIWSILGISVGLVAGYCIGIAETLQPTLFYEQHRWSICAGLVIAGACLFAGGRYLNRRSYARYMESQALLPEADRDKDTKQWQPFLLFNLQYWGVVVISFGCIIVFFVPTHGKRELAKVAARAAEAAPTKRKPATRPEPVKTNAPAPLEIPRFRLQGITLRQPNPSALIDGRTYFVGDWVKDGKIIAIDAKCVVLEWHDIKVTLYPPQ